MKRKNLLYILPVALACVACVDDANGPVSGGDIFLNATVNGMESRAAASPYLGATPTVGNPLTVWVWFSEDATAYGDSETDNLTHLPCRTTLTFNGAPQFATNSGGNNLKYGTDGAEVHCVGFYPAENVWSTTDNKNVMATIDGQTDLMFAPTITGKWGAPMGTQVYKHLQTWIKVCICATSQEAADVWGKITNISVGTLNSVSVDVSTNEVTYSGEKTMPVFESTEGQPLHTTMQEVGNVFCSPSTEYMVHVTIGGKTISKTIKVEPLESSIDLTTGGKLAILTLYFKPFNMIEGVCTLNAWDAQNEDLYMK